MPKNPGESLDDYKKRVIDPVSKSFCGAKWLNSTIWLGHGQTASCHHPPSHVIDIEEIQHNPSAIHNTKHKKRMRQMMLDGERPGECEYCWKIEDMGRDAISDRVYKTMIFKDEDLKKIAAASAADDVDLRTLEVSFDRTCNFACSYCNPAFSTTWVKDIRTNGPYQSILSDRRNHFTQDAAYAQPFSLGQENPYITAFWEWWPRLSTTLEEIRITGGEPLMSVDVWKLFEWFQQNPESRMRFAINSNLGAKPELIERLIEKSRHVSDLHIYTSCEAHGAQAEYIRDGLDYATWRQTIDRLATEGNVREMHMMMTINGLCLTSMTQFLDDVLDMKRAHGRRWPTISMNILRFPTFQSPLVLPHAYRTEVAGQLSAWLDRVIDENELCCRENMPLLSEFEIAHTRRLIDYLVAVEEPHAATAPRAKLEHDFKVFYRQYDQRRGKDFRATFPQLAAWYDGLVEIGAKTEENVDDWFARVAQDDQ